MKTCLTKKVPAVFITVAILFATVFSMSIFANAASTFTPRLDAPSSSNQYYYSDKNIFYKYGYGMPNCTAYAFGRAYELLGKEPNLSHGDAQQWYGYNKNNGYYSYGSTPKLGAIACWSYNGGGHVAVVEKIENGTITFSNSGWGYLNFYITTASTSASNPGQSNWTFQGYIYIGNFDTPQTTTTAKPQGTYKTGVYQTNVDDYLNMRNGAGTGYSYVTSIPDGVNLIVTKIETAGGYTWGYTTYNGNTGWVALDFCNYVSEIPTTQPTTTAPVTQPTTQYEEITIPEGMGDVSGDGVIDINDSTLLQRYLSGVETLTSEQLAKCDVDSDGTVSVNDSTTLQRYFAQ